jgi:hypothetical protein
MELEETTAARNAEPEMESYYLHRLESPSRRWGLAVEQIKADNFSVSVTYMEPNWPVHGVARHWSYESRDVAEALYLQLQKLLADVDEQLDLRGVTALLPPPERIANPEDETNDEEG